jgi:putative ABC transport system permease protein
MRRVALRGIRAHLVRFLLSVLAVTLGVAFVAGTFSLRTMLSSTFTGIIDSAMLGDVYVRGSEPAAASVENGGTAGDTRNKVPISLAGSIDAVDGVKRALPDISGPLILVGKDGTAVTSTQAPSFGMALYPEDDTIKLAKGRAPQGAGEIALESVTLASSGLAVGDRTTVVVGGEMQTATVVGEVSMGAPMAGATISFLDVATATTAYAPDGLVPTISVYGNGKASEKTLADRIAPVLSGSAQAVTGDSMRAESRKSIESMLGFITTFLMVFAGISLFVGAFIIANTFSMSVRQRMREFALLRAVGASPTQVFGSILIQAGVVGLLGSALGIGAGLGLVSILRVAFERMGMDLSGTIPLDTSTVVISVLVGTLVSIAAAALPARRAALTPPVEAMRDDVVVQEKSLRVRAVAGGILITGGLASLLAAMKMLDANRGALLGFAAVGLLVGVLLIAPVLVRSVMGTLAAVFVPTIKPLGRLARGNVTRNPRRTANTAGALMIGMALVGAASVLAASTQASTRSIVANEMRADYIVQSASRAVPGGAVTAMAALPSVGHADPLSFGSALVTSGGATPSAADSTQFVGVPSGAFGRSLDVETVSGSLASLDRGEIAVQRAAAKDHGWKVGDELTLTSDSGPVRATIGAVVDSKALGVPVILPESVATQVVPSAREVVDTVFLTAAPGVTLEKLHADLVGVAKPYVVLSVLNQQDFASQLADQVNQVLVILYALLGLSVVIAILGIVNTLALSVIERTREIGLMRAVGLGRLQLAGIVTIESVLTALFGTAVGVLIGVTLAAALPTVLSDSGLTTLVIPWAQLAWMLALAAGVGVLAALWPATRAARLPVLDAVAFD